MNELPSVQAEIRMEIPFHHLDILGIAWHGHYCEYLEAARCALLDKIGFGYLAMKETGFFWPIVDLHLRYLLPARFGQPIRIEAKLVEWEYRMKMDYRIWDAETGRVLAKAQTVQVAVDSATGEMCYASPPVFLERLKAYHEGG